VPFLAALAPLLALVGYFSHRRARQLCLGSSNLNTLLQVRCCTPCHLLGWISMHCVESEHG
jgi:hypothetical protein